MNYIDFEYSRSSEPKMRLFCCAWNDRAYWLLDDEQAQNKLRDELLQKKGETFVSYASMAECRSFTSLGLNPSDYNWIDLWAEYRLISNRSQYSYGKQYAYTKKDGYSIIETHPKRYKDRRHDKTNHSLGNALLRLMNIEMDMADKDRMRDLILEDRPEYSEIEKAEILKYCFSDIRYLEPLLLKIKEIERQLYPTDVRVHIDDFMLNRGEYVCEISKMLLPIDLVAMKNFSNNYPEIKEMLIQEVNAKYPFFKKIKKIKSYQWVEREDLFAEYIESKGIDWPKTPSGGYRRDRDTLRDFSTRPEFPELEVYAKNKYQMQQAKWYRPGQLEEMNKNIGSDGYLRCYLNPFGAQTGRQAPPAKTFIPAQSKWLRCLLRPKAGTIVISADYCSQEVLIGGILSGDGNMVEMYKQSDPYIFFGQKAGRIPEGGTKETHPAERKLCKPVVLGMMYGMGIDKLWEDLKVKAGYVPRHTAAELHKFHKRFFKTYWRWADKKLKEYHIRKCWVLPNGWAIWGEEVDDLSAKNYPVQGTAQVILQQAIADLKGRAKVLFTYHDSINIECRPEQEEEMCKLLQDTMLDAARTVLDNSDMRLEMVVRRPEEVWIENEAKEVYNKFKPYLLERNNMEFEEELHCEPEMCAMCGKKYINTDFYPYCSADCNFEAEMDSEK